MTSGDLSFEVLGILVQADSGALCALCRAESAPVLRMLLGTVSWGYLQAPCLDLALLRPAVSSVQLNPVAQACHGMRCHAVHGQSFLVRFLACLLVACLNAFLSMLALDRAVTKG